MLLNDDNVELKNLHLKNYFLRFYKELNPNIGLDILTSLLSDSQYTETKPLFTKRELTPKDNRFTKIAIIYDDLKKIRVITWDIFIRLSQLENIFGKSIVHYIPYDNSTEFVFKSANTYIEIIKTRFPSHLERIDSFNFLEYSLNDKTNKIIDPELSFIQMNIKPC